MSGDRHIFFNSTYEQKVVVSRSSPAPLLVKTCWTTESTRQRNPASRGFETRFPLPFFIVSWTTQHLRRGSLAGRNRSEIKVQERKCSTKKLTCFQSLCYLYPKDIFLVDIMNLMTCYLAILAAILAVAAGRSLDLDLPVMELAEDDFPQIQEQVRYTHALWL